MKLFQLKPKHFKKAIINMIEQGRLIPNNITHDVFDSFTFIESNEGSQYWHKIISKFDKGTY